MHTRVDRGGLLEDWLVPATLHLPSSIIDLKEQKNKFEKIGSTEVALWRSKWKMRKIRRASHDSMMAQIAKN